MISPLENLAGTGKPLVEEPMDSAEPEGLLRSGRARLVDARNASLALESRFDLAYNAAHALCLAAVRRHGYRARHRYIVFQILPHTLGLGRKYGACWTSAITCATSPSTKGCSMWTNGSWPTWSRRVKRS